MDRTLCEKWPRKPTPCHLPTSYDLVSYMVYWPLIVILANKKTLLKYGYFWEQFEIWLDIEIIWEPQGICSWSGTDHNIGTSPGPTAWLQRIIYSLFSTGFNLDSNWREKSFYMWHRISFVTQLKTRSSGQGGTVCHCRIYIYATPQDRGTGTKLFTVSLYFVLMYCVVVILWITSKIGISYLAHNCRPNLFNCNAYLNIWMWYFIICCCQQFHKNSWMAMKMWQTESKF